jgi:hypothetical protein
VTSLFSEALKVTAKIFMQDFNVESLRHTATHA